MFAPPALTSRAGRSTLRCATLWCSLALAAVGCRSEAPAGAADARAVDAAPVAPTPAPHQFRAELMGTPFGLTLAGDVPLAQARAAADAAFTEIARVEARMSEWRPDSEIGRINAAAGAPVAVSDETRALLKRALGLAEASGGAFDPSWAALRGIWRFASGDTRPKLPLKADLEAALARVDFRAVRIEGRAVRLAKPGMALGLGGIAKGYAIDRAAAVLRARGVERFIVDGGGDLYVAGRKPDGRPWTIGVRHPRGPGLLAELPVTDAAVVSSGDYERFFELGGRRYHHIIDLRSGMPADRSVAVTVRAPEATLADALATAIFVLGPEAGLALAGRYPGVEAAVLAPDGAVYATPGLKARLPARWQPG